MLHKTAIPEQHRASQRCLRSGREAKRSFDGVQKASSGAGQAVGNCQCGWPKPSAAGHCAACLATECPGAQGSRDNRSCRDRQNCGRASATQAFDLRSPARAAEGVAFSIHRIVGSQTQAARHRRHARGRFDFHRARFHSACPTAIAADRRAGGRASAAPLPRPAFRFRSGCWQDWEDGSALQVWSREAKATATRRAENRGSENPLPAQQEIMPRAEAARVTKCKFRASRPKLASSPRGEFLPQKGDGEEGRKLHARRFSRTNTSI
jgi:hypothetical protein